MSGEHTPGEWIASGSFVYASNGFGTNRFYMQPQPGFTDDVNRTPDAELEANAKLAAAAPDLLAAGERMADDYQVSEQHHPNHVLVPVDAFNALRAAIQKARG